MIVKIAIFVVYSLLGSFFFEWPQKNMIVTVLKK
jgi:hypothetical protein